MVINARRDHCITLMALTGALLVASFGCTSKREKVGMEGVFISTSLPLASYIQGSSRVSDNKGPQFFFPQLEIYDESENLIYTSHEAIENARLLRELPDGIRSLRPKLEPARLTEIMDKMPAFRAREKEILGQHRVSVLSVFLEDCHACSIQEDALSAAEHQLLDHGINLLVIRVSRK